MKNNFLRKILGGISFTSALFIFQACYGTPQDFGMDLLIEGQVKSKTSGLPINGIKVSIANNIQYSYTNEDGKFSLYTEMTNNITLSFEDIDLTENGVFIKKDTLLTNYNKPIFLDIELAEE
ncbi:MAG: hypothetical protein WC305_07175 [Bacteroidales bacterium]